ncbi:Predicted P-loop ATPase, KAP-like [Epibacterium ulvae]|uniref:Predicted P-loop ATPase, KAP-like n=1 Tax=Epibacterium ulvae TaxID=1156985 RepID=A0A1G5RIF4_9RHOB|nr:P-loop NTPase fold protein [Epibacterium ulvae]SCZ73912.1 Predicted P-loop ATPase, KAP-like [Epibacterium ulvae]
MWSDNETRNDYLNHSEVAEMICEMISDDTLLPLSVGVYGGWGVGKSSILQLVDKQLARDGDTIVIEFDAWLYQGFDEAKAALMTVISQALIAEAPESLQEQAKGLFRRVNKLRLLGLGAEAGMAALGLPTFGFVSRAITSGGDALSGEGDEEDLKAIQEGAAAASNKMKGLIDPKEVQSPPEEIAAFKAEFSSLLKDLDRRLVVFVDNLDRCLPKTAIENLEAMRLFLSLPNTAFVVAADVDMVRHAVASHFAGASKKHVDDYLDKLIQFPVAVPRLGLQEVQAFLCMLVLSRSSTVDAEALENARTYLLETIQKSWSGSEEFSLHRLVEIVSANADLTTQIENVVRIAPTLAQSKAVLGNPRIIKRMMNTVRMRHGLAIRRKMNLDEAVIAKISLFERCTSERAFGDLLKLVNASPKGKVKGLASNSLEKIASSTSGFPESWHDHKDFIAEWGQLSPDLSNTDLRAAVYLARETLPLQIKNAALSPDTIKAISALLKIATRTSKAAEVAIDLIPADERPAAMSELINSLRQDGDWSRKRADVNGAVVLATKHQETRDELVRFLSSIQQPAAWLKRLTETLQDGSL